ncbi:hypothetical protein HQ393_04905 [Chitinibacter bivalviorum]|uniref:N-acetyltransferase domain-containing protein n=1 Tax=Chitinibacter bivalviorum TaxID=2739434 RepID=A0A7H9BGD5_9NEIS|nr:hypothetical protein [Chitinibacter bivalviorum]QLG87645.1 hypothetical protein HQ393_04905 [Chitinibacter bivalviorum]
MSHADGKLTLEWVSPHVLGDVWPIIRPWVERVISKAQEPYLAEDVFYEIKAANARLFLFLTPEKEIVGHVVIQPLGKTLHLWQIFGVAGHSADVVLCLNEHLDAIAAGEFAKEITFSSPRKGWCKWLETIGFTPKSVVYQRELKHG